MKKIGVTVVLFFLTIASLWVEAANSELKSGYGMVGTILALKTDFDIYKTRHGNRESYTYSYTLMPAPEVGLGGRFYTYLGRMPAGTLLEIVSIETTRRAKNKMGVNYQVSPLSFSNDGIKGNISRTLHQPEVRLEDQSFRLISLGVGLGIYSEGGYSNGAPKLNDTWFEIVKLKE